MQGAFMKTSVTLKATGHLINTNIYGQFIEHALNCINGGIYDPSSPLSGPDGIRKDVLEKAALLAPPILRFPGGTIMCQYHWEDAVGPKEKRIRQKNLIWGDELDPSFGTAEFINFCRKIGAESMICVNMASGTPQEAGNWVEYCNGTGHTYYADLRRSHGYAEPFKVKYWCIGNESYAQPDIGIHHDVQLYIRDALEFIKFMKLTDRSIQTVIVGCDQDEWNKPVLDALHTVTDYFSIHHYSGENQKGIYGPFEGEKNLKDLITRIEKLLNNYPSQVTDFNPWYRFPPRQKKIAIALDEWNIWNFKDDETYGLLETYCWRDALWTASILNLILLTPSIQIANMAQMVNVLAPIISQKEGSWFQTTAYPLMLYRQNMQGELVQTAFRSPAIKDTPMGEIDALSISAAIQNGQLNIAAVNRDFDHDHVICLKGEKLPFRQKGTMICLTSASPTAKCSINQNCVQKHTFQADADHILLQKGSIHLISFPL